MIPRRGPWPTHFAPLARQQSLYSRSVASRQFSSIPQSKALPGVARSTNALGSTSWRAGARNPQCAALNASAVRYGSWYAPWTWGSSSKPPVDVAPISNVATQPPTPVPEPTVTSATPELAPAGINKASVVESAATSQPATAEATPVTVEGIVDKIIANQSGSDPSVFDPASALESFGALKSMGLDFGWGPTAVFEWIIEHAYIMSGWGWGGSIIAATLIIRTGGFYFQMRASDAMAKLGTVSPMVKQINAEMQEASKAGDTAKARVLAVRIGETYKELGAHPAKGMLPMVVQGVFGFGAFRCLRAMSTLPVPGLSQGGWLWFKDLTASDPYFVLPIASGAVFHVMAKYGGETGAQQATMSDGMKFTMQVGLPIVMVIITCWQSAGIQLYLLATTLLGTLTARILRNPSFREFFKLTPLPTAEATEMWTRVANKEIPLDAVWKNGKFKAFPSGANPNKSYTQKVIPATATVKHTQTKPSRTTPASQKPKYQPPARIQHRGLNLKAGTVIPSHLQTVSRSTKIDSEVQDRDVDFDHAPKEFTKRIGWYARNYRPKYIFNRLRLWLANMYPSEAGRLLQRKADIAKMKREEEDFRRRQQRK